eukprot:EG_transcript_9200
MKRKRFLFLVFSTLLMGTLIIFLALGRIASSSSIRPHQTAHSSHINKGTQPMSNVAKNYSNQSSSRYHAVHGLTSPTVQVDLFRSLRENIVQEVSKEFWGPDVSLSVLEVVWQTGCDVFGIPTNFSLGARCVQYMGNFTNWKEVVPMMALFDERTIKFRIHFKNKPLQAILKVPQRMFNSEPFSEYATYLADDILEYHRVPPTTLVQVPISWLLAAVNASGKRLHMTPENAKASGVKDYHSWLQKDVVQFARERGWVQHRGTAQESVWASVQLWMAEVYHLLDTVFYIPYPRPPEHSNDPKWFWHRYYEPAIGFPPKLTIPLLHIASQLMFDYVLGNADRSPNKNNYVVGGCKARRCRDKTPSLRHPGPPDFLYLDHGMAFLHTGPPRDTPISKRNGQHCFFWQPAVVQLVRLADRGLDPQEIRCLKLPADVQPQDKPLEQRLREVLPAVVLTALGPANVKACQTRLHDLLRKICRCLGEWPVDVVYHS